MDDKPKVARLYKSHMPYNRIQFSEGLEAVFQNGRFSTIDPRLIDKLDKIAEFDRAMGIYVDPEEVETSLLPPGTDFELRQQQIAEFMKNQMTKIDAGNTVATPSLNVATTADSPTTGGRSVPAPHFTKADVEALLKSKAVTPAASTTGTAVSTSPAGTVTQATQESQETKAATTEKK